MPLTDLRIKAAKAKDRPYKISHRNQFFLYVSTTGARSFRWNYSFQGKQKTISYGVYPEITMAEAVAKWEQDRKILRDGADPAEHRKVSAGGKPTFERVTREWFKKRSTIWVDGYSIKVIQQIELHLIPYLGSRPMDEIMAPELLRVLRRVEDRGTIDAVHRLRSILSQIFRYGVATGTCDRDPAADLKGAFTPRQKKHMATITDESGIGALLRVIDGYAGQFVTLCALRLSPYVFVRPGELRRAEWQEIDAEAANWTLPPEKMKTKQKHVVPLSRQALAIIEDLRPLTGRGQYLFPSVRTNSRPMSENTVNGALRRLGIGKDEFTGHGFRAMASTRLHELGWPHDVIELQLAHRIGSSVSQAYNHSQKIDERRQMMQAWADYLDGLKAGGEVIPLFKKA